MAGPSAARMSVGFEPKCMRISPTVFSAMRARVPRQPAWIAATARFFGSTSRIGTQSAVCTPSKSAGCVRERRIAFAWFGGTAAKG